MTVVEPMCDTDLVERVARAICQAHCSHWGMHFRHIARAAIASIDAAGYVVVPREPTEKMRIAGDIACAKAITRADAADACFKAMIQAAREKDKANAG